jgi:hypothetical protein
LRSIVAAQNLHHLEATADQAILELIPKTVPHRQRNYPLADDSRCPVVLFKSELKPAYLTKSIMVDQPLFPNHMVTVGQVELPSDFERAARRLCKSLRVRGNQTDDEVTAGSEMGTHAPQTRHLVFWCEQMHERA